MKLTVLSEARALEGFGTEHGLSYLIEADGKKILFDTGASDLFRKNAGKLGIDLEEVDLVVLSHGHFDHGDGLAFIRDKPLVCHPGCFRERFRKSGLSSIGLALSKAEVESRMRLETTRKPRKLTAGLWFLGEIPRENDFEATRTNYVLEGGREDFITDDSGLAYATGDRLVVISGCAHSGICNIISYAGRVTGAEQVEAVVGGFHLSRLDHRTDRTISCMKELGIKRVMPSHCTMEPALGAFRKVFGDHPVRAGDTIDFL